MSIFKNKNIEHLDKTKVSKPIPQLLAFISKILKFSKNIYIQEYSFIVNYFWVQV